MAKNKGWFNQAHDDPLRHGLSAKGIKNKTELVDPKDIKVDIPTETEIGNVDLEDDVQVGNDYVGNDDLDTDFIEEDSTDEDSGNNFFADLLGNVGSGVKKGASRIEQFAKDEIKDAKTEREMLRALSDKQLKVFAIRDGETFLGGKNKYERELLRRIDNREKLKVSLSREKTKFQAKAREKPQGLFGGLI